MKYLFYFAVLLLTSCFGKSPEETGMEGKMLPAFGLQMSDSTTYVNTGDIAAGQPMVFFLFSAHCPYCRSQLARLVDEVEVLRDIPIYMITSESYKVMKDFYNANQLSQYPNIKVGRDTAAFFGKYMDVKGIPFLALYDKNKRLVRAFMGSTKPHLIKSILSD